MADFEYLNCCEEMFNADTAGFVFWDDEEGGWYVDLEHRFSGDARHTNIKHCLFCGALLPILEGGRRN